MLLTEAVGQPPGDAVDRHLPIVGRLAEVLRRGRDDRQFDATPPVTWQIAAVVALGHAAGQEIAADRMSSAAAGVAFRSAVLRLCRPATDSR